MNHFKKKQWKRIGCCAAVILAAVLWLTGVFTGKPVTYFLKNRGDLGPVSEADIEYVTVKTPEATGKDGTVSAKDWEKVYPYIVATMGANKENSYVTSYLEQDPYLVNIYEGYGFAKDYGSARGHEYTLEDVAKTERPHAKANCLTCKTPNFAKLVNDEGVEVYSRPFDEVMGQMEENISCYTCHGNEAGNGGQIVITHSYVNKALGDNVNTIDPKTLNCGQCHIEYYFTPEDSETMMPYHSVEGMTPEAILAYYDEMGFYDWIQPSTGTKMLKAQHPEMETVLSGKHAGLLTCADCHMPLERNEDGVVYHSHTLVSPLENETLLADCAVCHADTDMVSFVRSLQERVTKRESEVGNKLSDLKDALAAAVEAGEKPEFQLDMVRDLYRKAQWYFDFCYVENAEGAHNSSLATECLNTSEEYIAAALEALNKELQPIDPETMMRTRPVFTAEENAPAGETAGGETAEGSTEEAEWDPMSMMRARPAFAAEGSTTETEWDPMSMMRARPAFAAEGGTEKAEWDPMSMMRERPDTGKLEIVPAAEEAPAEDVPAAEAIDPESMMRTRPDTGKMNVIDPETMMRARPDTSKLEIAPAAEEPAEVPAVEETPAAEAIDPETMMRTRPDPARLEIAPAAEKMSEVPAAEEAPAAEAGDAERMMRARPAR